MGCLRHFPAARIDRERGSRPGDLDRLPYMSEPALSLFMPLAP
jgi:hypothetical protein